LIDRSEDGVLGAGDAGRKNGLPGWGLFGDLLPDLGASVP
jgi:hypothetical protein